MPIDSIHCPACGGPIDPDRRACPRCGATVATRRCGVCFGMSLNRARNCRHCGARLPEEDPGHRPDRLACCGCGSAMTPRRLDNTLFDECDHCGGLWLCPGTLTVVRSEAEARSRLRAFDTLPPTPDVAHAAPLRYRPCPICARHMNRSNFARGSGVVLDTCRDHGSYFDRGELTRIFRFIESGGLEKAFAREAEERRSAERDSRRQAIMSGSATAGSPGGYGGGFTSPNGIDLLGWIHGWLTR